jgi:hypothetical protein
MWGAIAFAVAAAYANSRAAMTRHDPQQGADVDWMQHQRDRQRRIDAEASRVMRQARIGAFLLLALLACVVYLITEVVT